MNPLQNDSRAAPAAKHPLFAILMIAGVFAIFIVIYLISHQPARPLTTSAGGGDDDKWRYSSEGRSGKLAELRAKEQTAATTYGWVDQGKGTVRLPIDRAMELVIQDLNTPARKR